MIFINSSNCMVNLIFIVITLDDSISSLALSLDIS